MENKPLYYLKWLKYLMYLKKDNGRRVKTTFQWFMKNYNPEKKYNWQDDFELVPIDEEYEKRRDEYEAKKAMVKENESNSEELALFNEYNDVADWNEVIKRSE